MPPPPPHPPVLSRTARGGVEGSMWGTRAAHGRGGGSRGASRQYSVDQADERRAAALVAATLRESIEAGQGW